jgi:hypothetical protein
MPRPPYQRPEHYAVEQEILRHDDAVNWYGEMTAFIQWWHVDDFVNGLVARCTRCFPWQDSDERRIAEAFEQASQTKCPVCYGTTFEGGYKAITYAPAIWSPGPESSDAIGRHGDHYVRSAQVQPSSIVKLRDGDTAVRLDGTRWRLASPLEGELSTGFGFHGELNEQMRSAITANIQDPTSVDYLVVISFANLDMEGPSPMMTSPAENWIVVKDTQWTHEHPLALPTATWVPVPNNKGEVDTSYTIGNEALEWWSPTNRFLPTLLGDFFSFQVSFSVRTVAHGLTLTSEFVRGPEILYHRVEPITLWDAPQPMVNTATFVVSVAVPPGTAYWRVRCDGEATLSDIVMIIRREYQSWS